MELGFNYDSTKTHEKHDNLTSHITLYDTTKPASEL